MRENKGITLISLVITIIILIILAGVAINLTIGENGIFNKAKYAKDEYLNAQGKEEHELNELYAYLASEDLPENTKDTDAGTIVKLPEGWQTVTPNYVSTTDGSIVTKSAKVASVYAVSAGNGETIPVPVGFWYVGGNLSTGVVISDKEADSYLENGRDMTSHDDAINLIGNQFVWIPCTKENYVKTSYGSGYQNANCDTTTNSAELTQIEKYGGFYVGRYEAGLPEGTAEFTGSVATTSDEYNMSGVPQSKAGVSPWNFVDWNNSQSNCKKMYEVKSNIRSALITGTQWDVMINKIGSLTDESGNTKYSLTDSALWGNYSSGDTNGFTFRGHVSELNGNYQYAFTTPTSTTKANNTYYLLKTGASDHNLTYNLYDLAGNVWEWTEEYSAYQTSGLCRVLRGGSLYHASSTYPACFRDGSNVAGATYSNVGFRVVLYIQ